MTSITRTLRSSFDSAAGRFDLIVNTVSEVSSERISPISAGPPGSKFTATVWEKAVVPESPASPHPLRNGLLTLVVGLALSVGLMAERGVLRR